MNFDIRRVLIVTAEICYLFQAARVGIFEDTALESIVVTRNSDVASSRGADGDIDIDSRQINRVVGSRTRDASGAIRKVRQLISARFHNNRLIAFLHCLTQFHQCGHIQRGLSTQWQPGKPGQKKQPTKNESSYLSPFISLICCTHHCSTSSFDIVYSLLSPLLK